MTLNGGAASFQMHSVNIPSLLGSCTIWNHSTGYKHRCSVCITQTQLNGKLTIHTVQMVMQCVYSNNGKMWEMEFEWVWMVGEFQQHTIFWVYKLVRKYYLSFQHQPISIITEDFKTDTHNFEHHLKSSLSDRGNIPSSSQAPSGWHPCLHPYRLWKGCPHFSPRSRRQSATGGS